MTTGVKDTLTPNELSKHSHRRSKKNIDKSVMHNFLLLSYFFCSKYYSIS